MGPRSMTGQVSCDLTDRFQYDRSRRSRQIVDVMINLIRPRPRPRVLKTVPLYSAYSDKQDVYYIKTQLCMG